MKLKSILFIFYFFSLWNVKAQIADSTSRTEVEKSFVVSANGLIPLNDLAKIGAHGGFGVMPGLSLDFKKSHFGFFLNVEVSIMSFNENDIKAYYRNKYSELVSYSDSAGAQNDLMKAGVYLGGYYEYHLPHKLCLKFSLLGSKSYDLYALLGSRGHIHAFFYTQGNSINYSSYPEYPNINISMSMELMKSLTNRFSLGFRVGYTHENSKIEEVESRYNGYTHQTEDISHFEKLNFSYLQAGVSIRLRF